MNEFDSSTSNLPPIDGKECLRRHGSLGKHANGRTAAKCVQAVRGGSRVGTTAQMTLSQVTGVYGASWSPQRISSTEEGRGFARQAQWYERAWNDHLHISSFDSEPVGMKRFLKLQSQPASSPTVCRVPEREALAQSATCPRLLRRLPLSALSPTVHPNRPGSFPDRLLPLTSAQPSPKGCLCRPASFPPPVPDWIPPAVSPPVKVLCGSPTHSLHSKVPPSTSRPLKCPIRNKGNACAARPSPSPSPSAAAQIPSCVVAPGSASSAKSSNAEVEREGSAVGSEDGFADLTFNYAQVQEMMESERAHVAEALERAAAAREQQLAGRFREELGAVQAEVAAHQRRLAAVRAEAELEVLAREEAREWQRRLGSELAMARDVARWAEDTRRAAEQRVSDAQTALAERRLQAAREDFLGQGGFRAVEKEESIARTAVLQECDDAHRWLLRLHLLLAEETTRRSRTALEESDAACGCAEWLWAGLQQWSREGQTTLQRLEEERAGWEADASHHRLAARAALERDEVLLAEREARHACELAAAHQVVDLQRNERHARREVQRSLRRPPQVPIAKHILCSGYLPFQILSASTGPLPPALPAHLLALGYVPVPPPPPTPGSPGTASVALAMHIRNADYLALSEASIPPPPLSMCLRISVAPHVLAGGYVHLQSPRAAAPPPRLPPHLLARGYLPLAPAPRRVSFEHGVGEGRGLVKRYPTMLPKKRPGMEQEEDEDEEEEEEEENGNDVSVRLPAHIVSAGYLPLPNVPRKSAVWLSEGPPLVTVAFTALSADYHAQAAALEVA